MTRQVVFAKIGWKKLYDGSRDDDPKPIGAGTHNKGNTGGETFNFCALEGGKVHGFVHTGKNTPGKHDGLNLRRIDPSANPATNSLDGILVVFLAKVPPEYNKKLGRGICVVGWYDNATVYDSAEHNGEDRSKSNYNLEARAGAWVRIPWYKRTRQFDLSGKGGMSRTNIRYPYRENGEPDDLERMKEVLEYVQDWDPQSASPRNVSNEIELEEALFQNNPRLRKLVERYAVDQAEQYYTQEGYQVEQKGKPYDLLCKKQTEELFVEVKGTMQSGSTILLTLNEVEQRFLRYNGTAELFVVCRIQSSVSDPTSLSGGKIDIYSRWIPSDHPMIPLQFQCDLDEHRITKTLSVSDNCTS